MTSVVVLSLPPSAAPDSQGEPETRLKNWIQSHAGAKHGIASIALPDLKIGTLDNLVSMSEEIAKVDGQLQGIIHKVNEVIGSIYSTPDEVAKAELVEGRPAWQYLQQFGWNTGKYRPDKPIAKLVELAAGEAFSADSDLKQRYASYQAAKSSLTALERKQGGDLTVRSLDRLVTRRDIVTDSEYLTSVLVVVGNAQVNQFLAAYETLVPMVVPRSAKKLAGDKDYALYSVTLFKKVAEDFEHKAREQKWIIRELEFSDDMADVAAKERQSASEAERRLRGEITRLASAAFADVVKAWGHIRVMRVFVESVLRYGLPPNFVTAAFVPEKSLSKTEQILVDQFGYLAGSAVAKDKNGKIKDEDLGEYGALLEHDYKPFVLYVFDLP